MECNNFCQHSKIKVYIIHPILDVKRSIDTFSGLEVMAVTAYPGSVTFEHDLRTNGAK